MKHLQKPKSISFQTYARHITGPKLNQESETVRNPASGTRGIDEIGCDSGVASQPVSSGSRPQTVAALIRTDVVTDLSFYRRRLHHGKAILLASFVRAGFCLPLRY